MNTKECKREAAKNVLHRHEEDLRALSYEELRKLALDESTPSYYGWREIGKEIAAGEELVINGLISEWGIVFPRISVELAVYNEDGSISPSVIGCVYYEVPKPDVFTNTWRWQITLVGILVLIIGLFSLIYFFGA